MKPTFLHRGDRVLVRGKAMTFVHRIPAWKTQLHQAINVFRCEAYVGLNGPQDTGLCELTDSRVSRDVQRVPEVA